MTGWLGWLERLLTADPRDVGCDRTCAVLHVYVELLVADLDAAGLYPGVAAHLAACGSCADDARGLLAAVQDEGP